MREKQEISLKIDQKYLSKLVISVLLFFKVGRKKNIGARKLAEVAGHGDSKCVGIGDFFGIYLLFGRSDAGL